MRDQKFLVNLINSLTKRELFIAAWVVLGVVPFFYLWWNDYKKSSRRNFKEPNPNEQDQDRSLTLKNKESRGLNTKEKEQ